ncbi:MAG TPA: hypothetical protein VL463_09265 [Kofleriaceae bacterium]|jgi:hypothetical protein|nr:hypothetical protein [Kofleriaceae bacterium]
MRPLLLPKLIFAAALSTGCAGTLGYSTSASGGVYGPELVEAGPGVQVIADYDEPIFFADSFYWRYDRGVWFRSTSYTGGWGYAQPPAAIVRIDRPQRYTHYRPAGWTRGRGQQVRDHRDQRQPASRGNRRPPRRSR